MKDLVPPWWAFLRTRRLAKRLAVRLDEMNGTITDQQRIIIAHQKQAQAWWSA
jgi:hypothetical protein